VFRSIIRPSVLWKEKKEKRNVERKGKNCALGFRRKHVRVPAEDVEITSEFMKGRIGKKGRQRWWRPFWSGVREERESLVQQKKDSGGDQCQSESSRRRESLKEKSRIRRRPGRRAVLEKLKRVSPLTKRKVMEVLPRSRGASRR